MKRSNNKKNSINRHFIFITEKKNTGAQILFRTGIYWQSLLGVSISAAGLRQAFWAELKEVCTQYPQLVDTRKRPVSGKTMSVPHYNYIAPEGQWIEQINLDLNWLLTSFVPHLKNLFSGMILPTWIASQIINPMLTTIARIHSRKNANQIGNLFLKAAIDSFKESHGFFFSFLFNWRIQMRSATR